jgi:site-specific recombinase XerD
MLKDRALSPSSRLQTVIHLRIYLRWLHERKLITVHPDELVRSTDRPKLPVYLPRPLPPDCDKRLQERLFRSGSLYSRALLLMRLTGLRVGELMALPFECLSTDEHQRRFLKVPLGKMYNERLVPLDSRAEKLILLLQATPPLQRTHLLPRLKGINHLYKSLKATLAQATSDLPADAPITTHRLRHSYATSLLNAGMSLLGIMKLLGHKDYRMTLRYAAITQESVYHQYFDALKKLDFVDPVPAADSVAARPLSPVALLDQCLHSLAASVSEKRLPATLGTSLAKRLQRIKRMLETAEVSRP